MVIIIIIIIIIMVIKQHGLILCAVQDIADMRHDPITPSVLLSPALHCIRVSRSWRRCIETIGRKHWAREKGYIQRTEPIKHNRADRVPFSNGKGNVHSSIGVTGGARSTFFNFFFDEREIAPHQLLLAPVQYWGKLWWAAAKANHSIGGGTSWILFPIIWQANLFVGGRSESYGGLEGGTGDGGVAGPAGFWLGKGGGGGAEGGRARGLDLTKI